MLKKRLNKYSLLLHNLSLFNNIPEESVFEALQFLHAKVKSYKKGETVIRIGETLIPAGIILEGRLEISFQNNNDDSVNMNHFQSGETFGEAMVLADIPRSPMQAKTLENTIILFLNYKMLYIKPSDYPYAGRLALNLLQSFALKNVFLNQKIRIFSQKTLRDKILTYLNTLPKDQTGGLKLPFSKTSAAEFLGVNRSALSRELGRMKSEGMLREQDGKIYLPLKQN